MPTGIDLCVAPLHPDLYEALLAHWPVGAWDMRAPLLLVPNRGLGRALVRDAARTHGATFGADVRTLTDLAASIVEPRRRRLRAEAAAWLVRDLRLRKRRPPTSWDAALDAAGFRAAVRRAFDDLARAGLAERREIERVLLRHGSEMPLPLRHLLELLHAYRIAFDLTHDDRAALLVRAAGAPAGRIAALCGGAPVWLYGFAVLDAPESRFVDRLCAEPGLALRVFVPRGPEDSADPPLAARLVGRASVTVARQPLRPQRGPADVRAVAAPSAEAAADEAARAVLRAAGDGLRFESMSIQALDARTLALVATALRRAGVPFWEEPGRSVAATRCGRAVLGLLDVAAQGIQLEPVLAFLAMAPLRWTEWAGTAADPVPSAWERVAREAFVGTGRAAWETALVRLAQEHETRAEALEADSEPALVARAAAQSARELVRVVTALDTSLRMLLSRAAWDEWVEAMRRVVDAMFAPGDERDAVAHALERLRALAGLGRTQPSRMDFREALRGVLAATTLRPAVEPVAAVRVGTAAALWGAAFDFVCLVGLAEGEWPAVHHESSLLDARAREALASALPAPAALPTPAARTQRERQLFFDACAAARRRLVLVWARLDATTGAAMLPSTLLIDLARRRTAGARIDYATFERLDFVARVPLRRTGTDHGEPALHRAELEAWIASALPPAAARRWVAGLGLPASRGVAIERLRAGAARFTSADGWLASPTARAALGARMRGASVSATQLTTYATCPFRYFWRYLLGVEPLDRDDYRDLSALETGRLAHTVLERLYRDVEHAGRTVAELGDSELDVALDTALAAAEAELRARGRTGSRLLWDVRRRRLRDDLGLFLWQERAQAGAWRPRDLELRFGRGLPLAPVVETAGGRIWLRGSMDRVDAGARPGMLRIVDYKTGTALTAGKPSPRAVQLAVYSWVAAGGNPEHLAASEAAFVHVTRRGGFARQTLAGQRIEPGELERLVAGVVAGIARGELFANPGPDAVNCGACDYRRACEARVGVLSDRKQEGGQGAAFGALPDFGARLLGARAGEEEDS